MVLVIETLRIRRNSRELREIKSGPVNREIFRKAALKKPCLCFNFKKLNEF